uniref:Uncharacterized protein n=1 Tax=viral metagenome TaxID=1070528 RepID=A0A6C0BS33_9ZZZZ
MGNIIFCFKKEKEENKNLKRSIILSGRYCFQCNNVFETKQDLIHHKNYCQPRLRGDL